MYTHINERIFVNTDFTPEGTKPKEFSWKNKGYKIDEINFTHTSREGQVRLTHFAVSSNGVSYKITFNQQDLVWTLDEIYSLGFSRDSGFNDQSTNRNAYRF